MSNKIKALLIVLVAVFTALGVVAVRAVVSNDPPRTAASASPSAIASPDEGDGQPQPEKLEPPQYPSDSSCGRKGDRSGFDAQGVLAAYGLCIPLVTKPEGYVHWDTGKSGDFVEGQRNRVTFSQPNGTTSVYTYLTPRAPRTPTLQAVARDYVAQGCNVAPKRLDKTTVGGRPALHTFVRGCDTNADQMHHYWVIKRPDGRVIVVVAENPDDPERSTTTALVEESMKEARYFG